MKRSITFLILSFMLIALGNNFADAAAPNVQARYVAFTGVTNNQINLAWINGNGAKRIIVAYNVTDNGPVNWTAVRTTLDGITAEFTPSANFTLAPQIDAAHPNYKVVGQVSGATRTLTVTNLAANKNYSFHVFEYNGTAPNADYLVSLSTLNPRAQVTMPHQITPPTGVDIAVNSEGGLITWTANGNNATGYYLDVYNTATNTWVYSSLDIGFPSGADARRYWLLGLTAGQAHWAFLRSYDANRNVSPNSNVITFTTAATPVYSLTSWSVASPTVLQLDASSTVTLTTNPLQTGLQITTTNNTINGIDVSSTFVETAEGIYQLTYTALAGHAQQAAGGALPIDIILKDGNGVDGNNIVASGGTAPGVDVSVPTVTTVVTANAALNAVGDILMDKVNKHKIGDVIHFAVDFNEAGIQITGSPYIQLTDDKQATYNAVATTTLRVAQPNYTVFSYTALLNDNITDLAPLADAANANNGYIVLNGGTIKNANGNDAVTYAAGRISLNRTQADFEGANQIDIDGVRPFVNSMVRHTTTSPTNVNSVIWRVTFSEDIDDATLATTDFTVATEAGTNNGTVAGVANVGGTPTAVYDVTVSGVDTDNSIIRLNFTGIVSDEAGNASTTTYIIGDTYLIDNTNPTAAITTPVADAYIQNITEISGTAEDTGTPNSGLNDVNIAIWLDANGNGVFDGGEFYLNSAGWAFDLGAPHWIDVSSGDGFANWIFNTAGALDAINALDGVYYVQTQTIDNATNAVISAAASHRFIRDNVAPTQAAPVVASTGGNVVTGYFNNTNTGVNIPVVLADDASLVGGTFKIQYSTADDLAFTTNVVGFADVTAIGTHNIVLAEINTTVTKNLATADFEALVGEGNYIRFQVITTDQATNTVTSVASNIIRRDLIAPVIEVNVDAVTAATNGATDFIDVTFSEAVYTGADGTGTLVLADFNDLAFVASANGTALFVEARDVRQTNSADYGAATGLAGAETTIRMFFDVAGTPNGTETIEVKPVSGAAIYDIAGNAMLATASTGTKNLRDLAAPVISNISDGGATIVKPAAVVTITFTVVDFGGLDGHPVVQVWNSANTAQIGVDAVYDNNVVHTAATGTYNYTYTYTVPDVNESNVRISISATDGTNSVVEFALNQFNIDNLLPVLEFTAPAAASRTNGTQLLTFTRTETNPSANDYASIGVADPAIFASGTAIDQIAGWGAVAEDATFTVQILHTDLAGNPGTATRNFVKDMTAPTAQTLTIASNNANTDAARTGNTITVALETNEDVTITAQTIDAKAANVAGGPINWTITRLLDGSENQGVVNFSISIQDLAGNAAVITNAQITNSSSVTIDNTAPADAQISSVTTVTAPVVAGYWNASNTALTIVVPVANDATLEGGTIQLQASTDDFTTPLNLGVIYTILNTDVNSNKSFTIDAATFVGLAGFAEENVYKFRAVVADKAGNSTNGTPAATTIKVDQTAPAASVIASRTAVTGTVVANYFNMYNDAVSVTVEIPNDATLNGGKATLQARVGANEFVNVGQVDVAIAGGEVNSTKVLTVSKTGTGNTDLDDLTGWANTGVNVDFRVVLTDLAGNATAGTTFGTPLAIDMVAPTAPSNVVLNAGNTINANNQSNVSLRIEGETSTTYNYTITTSGGAGQVANTGTLDESPKTLTGINLITVEDGTITATVTLTDAAGNVSAPGTSEAISKNATPAVVTNVTVTNNNGTYSLKDGDTPDQITVRVTFNKNITYTPGDGQLELELETGATDKKALRTTSTDGTTNYIDLVYTVEENDVANPLDYTGINALVKTGTTGTIIDADGNPVTNLTLPALGGGNSIVATKAIVIDGVKPTFALQYYYNTGLSIAYADNPVFSTVSVAYLGIVSSKTLASAPTVSITSQGTENNVSNALTTNTAALTYRLTRNFVIDPSTDGTKRERITINAIDASGNVVVAQLGLEDHPENGNLAWNAYITGGTTTTQLGRIDGSAPTFTVGYYEDDTFNTSLGANPKLKAGTYYIKITANEALSAPPTISIAAEGTANDETNELTTAAGVNIYSFTRTIASDAAAVGTVAEVITLSGTDVAGNTASNVAPATHENTAVYTDTKVPVITPVTIASNNANAAFAKTGDEVTITLTSDETLRAVTGVTVTSVTSGGAAVTNATAVANTDNVWTVKYIVHTNDTDGAVAFNLTTTDLAGNTTAVTVITEGSGVTVDKASPTVATLTNTTSIGADRYAKTGETITVNFTAGAGELVSITAATIGGETLTAVPDAGFNNIYTFTYTTDGNETEGLQALSIETADRAGNTATFTHANLTDGSLQIIFDKTAPEIVAASITSPTAATIWNPGNKNITWEIGNISDAGGAGLSATPVSFEYHNGTEWVAIAGATNIANTSPFEWAVPDVTNTNARIKIIVKDNAGNVTEQLSDVFKIDNAGPDVVLTNNIDSRTEVKEGTIVSITATFTDAAATAIAANPTITITNGQGIDGDWTAVVMTETSNTVWYYDWTVPAGDYTCDITISGADLAGNASTAATGVIQYKVDNTRPNVTLTNSVGGRTAIRNADNPLTITATFTETNTIATGANAPKISIDYTNGTTDIVDAAMTVDGGNPKVYTYSWDLPATNETAVISVSAQDLAGNLLDVTDGPTNYTIDNVVPTATISRSNPAGEHTNADQVVWQIVFNEVVQGFTVADITLTGTLAGTSTIVSLASDDDITFLLTVDVPAAGNGTIGFNIGVDITDLAGNPFAGQSTDGTNIYTIDNSPPVIDTRTIATNGNTVNDVKYAKEGDIITLTLVASKPITQPTVTIGGEAATVSGGAPTTNYTATLTVGAASPVAEGNAAIHVSAYQDQASNAGTTYTTISGGTLVVVDREKPTIQSAGNVLVGAGLSNRFYIDLTFNTPVYTNDDGTGALTVADLAAPIIVTGADGAVTSATITHITQTNNTDPAIATPLAAGATIARVFFTTDVAPTGVETITLGLNNTAVYDAAGNDAVNQTSGVKTFPDRAAPSISNIAVDGLSDGLVWKKQGANAVITFNVVEVGGVQGNPTVNVIGAGTTAATFGTVFGSGTISEPFVYTYNYTVGAGNETMTVSIAVTDNANFTGTASLNPAFDVDNAAPTVESIARIGLDEYLNATETEASFTVTFNEPVSGVAANNFAIETTLGNAITGVVAAPVGVAPTNIWTVEVNTLVNTSGDATFKLNLNANLTGITDRAGNAQAVGFTDGQVFIRDVTNPIVTITPFTYPFTNGTQAVTFDVAETYPSLATQGALTGGTVVGNDVVSGVTLISAYNGYNLTEGLTTITISHTDLAGNIGTNTYQVNKDFTAPEITSIARTTPVAQNTNVASVTFTANFGEEVVGVANENFSLVDVNNTITDESITSTTGPAPALAWAILVNTGTGDGTLRLDLANNTNITDRAGNALVQATYIAGETYIIDKTPPVATVTITPNNGAAVTNEYIINNVTESITIVADFDDVMNTDIDPVITFNAELNAILGAFTSAVWTNNKTYTWVVPVNGIDLVKLNNTVNITTAVNVSGSVMVAKLVENVKVDQVLPTVASMAPAKTTYNKADGTTNTTFTVTFNEEMNTATTPVFDYSGTNLSGVFGAVNNSAWNVENTVYTATVPVTDDATTTIYDNTLRLTATSARDLAGNFAAQTSDDATFNVDMVAPGASTVTMASNNANTAYAKLGDDVILTIVSSEDLAQINTPLIDGKVATPAGTAQAWTITREMDGTETPGPLGFSFQIQDLSGNTTNVTDLTAGNAVIADFTAPTVLSIVRVGADQYLNATETAASFTVTFSEPVSGVAANNFAIQTTAGPGTVTGTVAAPVNVGDVPTNIWTVTVNTLVNTSGDATFKLNLNANLTGITDRANNALTAAYTSGEAYIRDVTNPIVTITEFTYPFTNGTQAVNFGVAETYLGTSTAMVTGGTLTAFVSGSIVNTLNGWTVDEGPTTITVRHTDAAGNFGEATYAVTKDLTAPQITEIVRTAAAAQYTNAASVSFTANFGEEVVGVANANFSLVDVNNTITGESITSTPGTAPADSWAIVVNTGTGDGTLRLDLANNTNVTDKAGNALVQATYIAGEIYTIDNTNPALDFAAPTPDEDTRVNGTQTIAYDMSDANNSPATQARINANAYADFASGAAISTLAGFAGLPQGNFTVEVQHTDLAGNQTTVSRQFFKDTEAPTATVAYNKTLLKRSDIGDNNFTITITYNEDMDQTVDPTIDLTNPDPTAALVFNAATSEWLSATVYLATYNIVDTDTNYELIDVAITGAKDLAQNMQTAFNAANAFSLMLEGPELTTVTIASNNANPTWAKVDDVVTVTFVASKNLQNVSATINGVAATIDGADLNWTAFATMTSGMDDGIVQFVINYEDLVANPGIPVTAILSGNNVTFDKTDPIVNITAPLAATRVNNRQITFDVDEANTGTTAASADGSTFAAFASGNMANALGGFAGLPEGAFTATIRHTDMAGNVGLHTVSLVKDITPPTISAMTLSCNNQVVNLTFSEAIYGNSNGTGGLTDAKISAVRTGSGANISGKTFTPAPAAGSTSAVVSLIWNGSFTGNEIVNIDAANVTAIYDEAGNAMVPGTPKQHYTNIPIAVTVPPQNTSVCVNSNTTMSVTANGGNTTAYQWQILDGAAYVDLANNAIYSGVTTNTLTFTNVPQILNGRQYKVVISNACNTGVNATTIGPAILTVNPNNTIVTHPSSIGTCLGQTANLSVTASGVGPFTYVWKYFNGTIWVDAANGVPAGATYTDLGTSAIAVTGLTSALHNYRVAVQGGCGPVVESNTAVVQVSSPPDVAITPSGTTTLCFGDDVLLTAGELEAGNITYQWNRGGNPIALATGRTYLASVAGDYTVTISNITTGCSETTPVATTVVVTPLPDATITQGPTVTICAGTNTTLTATEAAATSYNWFEESAPAISLGTNSTLNVSTAGTYKVTVVKDGCTATTAIGTQVIVNPLPTVSISGNAAGCETVLLTATTNATNPTYQWKRDGNNVGTDQNTYTATESGDYTVVVTDGVTSCVQTSEVNAVTVYEIPIAYNVTGGPFCSGETINIGLSNAQADITYKLFRDNVIFVSEQTPGSAGALTFTVVNAQAGVYTIIASNPECSNDMTGNVVVNQSIEDPTAGNVTKTYDGIAATALTASGAGDTFRWYQNSDLTGFLFEGATYAHGHTNAGTWTYYVTQQLGAGCESSPTTVTVTINQAEVSFALTEAVKTYNATAQSAVITPTSTPALVPADYTVTGNLGTNVGTYPITIALNNANFTMTTPSAIGSLVINKAPLTITADNKERCFGEANPTLTLTYDGFLGADNSASLTVQPTLATGATPASIAGNYDITFAQQATATNYDITHNIGQLTVKALPTPVISGPVNAVLNGDIVLSTATGKTDYVWTVGGGIITGASNTNSITVRWDALGAKTVTVTYTDNGCTGTSADHIVDVQAGCVDVTITTPPAPQETCVGGSVTFNVTVSGTLPITYAWYKSGDGTPISNDASLTINNVQSSDAGSYYVVVNNCTAGSAQSTAATLVVNTPVTATVTITTPNTTVCAGTEVTFTATPTNGGTTPVYQWKVNGGNVGANSNTLTYTPNDNDIVTVVLTSSLDCVLPTAATSNEITMNVNNVPAQPSTITGDAVVCAGTSGVTYSVTNVTGVTYVWTYSGTNATLTPNGDQVTINFAANATSGTLTVTPSNDCGNGTARTLAITVNPVIAITAQPQPTSASTTALFSVTTNVAATTYQWQVLGTAPGAVWTNVAASAPYSINNVDNVSTLNISSISGLSGNHYRVVVSGCGTDVTSNEVTLSVQAAVPTTQATLLYIGRSTSSLTFHFTPGNGTGRVAFIKEAGAPKLPEFSERNDYTNANSIYSSAPELSDGSRVVYYGDGTSVMITSLTRNKTYTITVYEYNIVGNDINTINFNTTINTPTVNQLVQATNRKEATDENELLGETFHIKRIWPNPVSNEINLEVNTDEPSRFEFELYNSIGELVYSRSMDLSGGTNAINLHLAGPGQLSAGQYNLRVRRGIDYIDQQIIIMP